MLSWCRGVRRNNRGTIEVEVMKKSEEGQGLKDRG